MNFVGPYSIGHYRKPLAKFVMKKKYYNSDTLGALGVLVYTFIRRAKR